jgi:hypothetical protein
LQLSCRVREGDDGIHASEERGAEAREMHETLTSLLTIPSLCALPPLPPSPCTVVNVVSSGILIFVYFNDNYKSFTTFATNLLVISMVLYNCMSAATIGLKHELAYSCVACMYREMRQGGGGGGGGELMQSAECT